MSKSLKLSVQSHMDGMTLDEMDTAIRGARLASNKPGQELRIQYMQEFLKEHTSNKFQTKETRR